MLFVYSNPKDFHFSKVRITSFTLCYTTSTSFQKFYNFENYRKLSKFYNFKIIGPVIPYMGPYLFGTGCVVVRTNLPSSPDVRS